MKRVKKTAILLGVGFVSVWAVYSIIHAKSPGHVTVQPLESREDHVVMPVEPLEWNRRFKTLVPKDEFTKALERVSSYTESNRYKSVVITIVDGQYFKIARNFHLFTQKLKLANVLAVSLDKDTHESLTTAGINSVYDSSVENATKKYTTFLSDEFKLKSAMKIKLLLRALKLGYGVLMTDVDVVFLKDPFDYFHCSHCDLEMSDNLPPHRKSTPSPDAERMCIGFFYARPTENAVRLVKEVHDSVTTDTTLWDQVEFNRLARNAERNGELVVNILDYELFPSGDPFFFDHYLVPSPFSKAVVYHLSWMNNVVEKTYRAREMGLWLLDQDGYYSSKSARYITYDNPLPELQYMEWRAFETAMKIAKLLGRILIIPKFTCPAESRKNGWPIDCRYRPVGECFCSLTEIVNIKHTPILDRHPWREHVFLSHPLVPSRVRELPSRMYIVNNELTHKYSTLHTKVYMTYHPKDLLRGATKDELLKWFKDDKSKVIRLRALYGNFWI